MPTHDKNSIAYIIVELTVLWLWVADVLLRARAVAVTGREVSRMHNDIPVA